MSDFSYETWESLLNSSRVRAHLLPHPLFDKPLFDQWMASKLEVDRQPSCRVRAIMCDGVLVGWCGIQVTAGDYELAVVIDPTYSGVGLKAYQQLMMWAKELGHRSVFIHFFHTRPRYRFLQKQAVAVYNSTLFGHQFTTYQLRV